MARYRLSQIKTETDVPMGELRSIVAGKLKLGENELRGFEIRRKSIDSRRKPVIRFVYTAEFETDRRLFLKKNSNLIQVDEEAEAAAVMTPAPGSEVMEGRPVIVGAGPCGLFAALELAREGYRPLTIERGPSMDGRVEAVERFRESRVLDPEANLLFGEGGAGTFSDGKIGTGIKDGFIRRVLAEFRDAGAGDEIMYLARPHIGTDILRTVIVNIRKRIEELGGEIWFDTRLDSLEITDGKLSHINLKKNYRPSEGKSSEGAYESGQETMRVRTDALILATGHSARDTFAMLRDAGLDMEQKAFSIGVRMEHPQRLIDAAQYGEENLGRVTDAVSAEREAGKLPPADYRINYKASNGRGVYSFCMCPGGEVVVCSTGDGELCVNGMSSRRRDSGVANSGILCDVRPDDFADEGFDPDDVLAGVKFQEKYERLAFGNGGRDFTPPGCSMKAFMGELYYIDNYDAESDPYEGTDVCVSEEEAERAKKVYDSLPDFAGEVIREAVPDFARRIKGYDDPDAVVTAVETRSSSPVRILRDERGESNIKGIYPAGEGAGYAGGITSAACDGIRAAHHIIEKFAPIA